MAEVRLFYSHAVVFTFQIEHSGRHVPVSYIPDILVQFPYKVKGFVVFIAVTILGFSHNWMLKALALKNVHPKRHSRTSRIQPVCY